MHHLFIFEEAYGLFLKSNLYVFIIRTTHLAIFFAKANKYSIAITFFVFVRMFQD